MKVKLSTFIFCLILCSCKSKEPVQPRDPREPLPILDPARNQREVQINMDQSRTSRELGYRSVSNRCSRNIFEPLDYAIERLIGCQDTYVLRLKFGCRFSMGGLEPLLLPLRYKDLELDLISESEEIKRSFPKKIFTDGDGIFEFSFDLIDPLGKFKLVVKRNRQTYELEDELTKFPILLPDSMCDDKKRQVGPIGPEGGESGKCI